MRLCELVTGKLDLSDVDEACSCSCFDELVAIDILDTMLLERPGSDCVEPSLVWDVSKRISLDIVV